MPKNELNLTPGMEVSFRGDVYQIRSSLSLTSFLLKHPVSGEEKVVGLKDISPVNTVNDAQQESQSAVGVRLSSEQWQQAKRREAVIRPLAELLRVPTVKATQAAKELNLSVRHCWRASQLFCLYAVPHSCTYLILLITSSRKARGRLGKLQRYSPALPSLL